MDARSRPHCLGPDIDAVSQRGNATLWLRIYSSNTIYLACRTWRPKSRDKCFRIPARRPSIDIPSYIYLSIYKRPNQPASLMVLSRRKSMEYYVVWDGDPLRTITYRHEHPFLLLMSSDHDTISKYDDRLGLALPPVLQPDHSVSHVLDTKV